APQSPEPTNTASAPLVKAYLRAAPKSRKRFFPKNRNFFRRDDFSRFSKDFRCGALDPPATGTPIC
ncbi:hypothetical protein, partial [Roseovarius sp. MBR-6]|uniref:hypothetical protein n=1 Tax=Roseovarius sp. MBR-6 TaxID=3156459 RepID=UPI0033986888